MALAGRTVGVAAAGFRRTRFQSLAAAAAVPGITCQYQHQQQHQQERHVSAYGYEQAKALVFSANGEPKDVLRLHSHSISPAHGSLLTIRFLASPINPADINTVQGVYPSKPPFTTALSTAEPSAVPGNEGVAEVLSAGADAVKTHGINKGDWVIMRRPALGTWRTHAQLDAADVVLLPPDVRRDITPVQAGTVSVNPCTAYAMLKGYVGGGTHSGDTLTDGDWFIQNGANSGVGRAAIQLAKQWNLRSINVIRARPDGDSATQALKAELQALGADVVITEEEAQDKSFSTFIKVTTKGTPLKLALNCVGGRSGLSLAKALSSGGWHVTYGAMAKQPLSIPAGLLIFKDLRFAGFWVSRWSDALPEEKEQAVKEVLELTRNQKFKDAPLQELAWEWDTPEERLKEAVQGTLEGFRSGKGVFVFGKT